MIQLKKADGSFVLFWNQFFYFEAYWSISVAMKNHDLVFPLINNGHLKIEGLFHPLLESPVKNNFRPLNNVVIITGPNMSGKSTFLKALTICIYLAHLGIGVPATSAEIPLYTSISLAVNLSDELSKGYSHFMMEIVNLKNVVQSAKNEKIFAVFDELFRGTNIEDAIEISRVTIEGLKKFPDSLFIISTHINQLRENLDDVDSYFFGCSLNNGAPLFSYQLESGWSDLKLGKILFEKEGLNELFSVRK